VLADTINDFALFCLRVWGNGEPWACGGMSGFGGWCKRRSGVDRFGIGRIGGGRGWIHERDGGGTELCLGRDDFDAAAEDVDGGRHVAVVWKC
jgi:hypothetical protein